MGAAHAVNPKQSTCRQPCAELTGGRGADVAFEVVGHGDTVATAMRGVRKGGTVVLIGNLRRRSNCRCRRSSRREMAVLGSCASSGEIPECIELLARGVIDVAPIISLSAPLDDGPELFERLYSGDRSLMKVIIQP